MTRSSTDAAPDEPRWPADWSRPAREIATAAVRGTAAVVAADAEVLGEAAEELVAQTTESVDVVFGAAIRELLEHGHPDGLDRDDIDALLARCIRASVWLPRLSGTALAVVAMAALGILDAAPEGAGPTRTEIVEAALVMITVLASSLKVSVTDCVRGAMGEVARSETMELP